MPHPQNPRLGTNLPISETWRPKISKDPDHLLSLALIPPHLVKHIPEERRPGPPTQWQRRRIRNILNLKCDEPLKRCRGTKRDGTRCKRKAGQGTKGDFYGLGVETGTLGVGYCSNCIKHQHILPNTALEIARQEVKFMQQYGNQDHDPEYSKIVAREEVALAEQSIKIRDEHQLVLDTLENFKTQLEATDKEKKPTEMSRGEAVPMCDKTRISLMLDIAKVLSRLSIDSVKLDAAKYILVDHVLIAFAEFGQSAEHAMRRVEELTMQKHVKGEEVESGDTPVVDYVKDVAKKEWLATVRRMQSKVGRG